jgi:predicted lipoprotein
MGCLDQRSFKETRMKLYNTKVLPAHLYGSQNWIFKVRETGKITAAEMQYVIKSTIHLDRL